MSKLEGEKANTKSGVEGKNPRIEIRKLELDADGKANEGAKVQPALRPSDFGSPRTCRSTMEIFLASNGRSKL